MSSATSEHRQFAPLSVACAVLTVSDSRTLETDTSGALIVELLEAKGHLVSARDLCPDDRDHILARLERWVADDAIDAILMTGGTGISARDQTPDVVSGLFDKVLFGFGELFRMLSFQEIGPAAMLSRADAGVCGNTLVFLMPGSRAAVKLALERLILPELPHAVGLLRPDRRRTS